MTDHAQPTLNDAELAASLLAARVRFISAATVVLFLSGWIAWFAPFDDLVDRSGTPWGADFPAFYLAGRMLMEGDAAKLYDAEAAHARLHQLFPSMTPDATLPFRYPPFFAVWMAPLAMLPYPMAFALFLTLSVAALWTSGWLLLHNLTLLQGCHRRSAWMFLLGFPAVLECLFGGQCTIFALLIVSATLDSVRRKRWILGGAVLALALYKPNLLCFFALGLVLRYPRLLLGAIPMALWLGGISIAAVGCEGVVEFVQLGQRLAAGTWDIKPPAWKIHGLGEWLQRLVPNAERSLLLVLGCGAAAVIAWRWRSAPAEHLAATPISLATLLTLQTLCNPYLPIYDLSLLAIATMLTVEAMACETVREGPRITICFAQFVLGWLWFGPHLSQALAKASGAQVFSLGLLCIGLWQVSGLFRASYSREGQFSGESRLPA